MNKLVFRAGREAFELIEKFGFSPEMVKAVVSAAGGPKWFTTYGLTRFIIGDLLNSVAHPIHYMGSSVGSWQMTAALTSNPSEAIDRLQKAYATSTYSDIPDAREISRVCEQIIKSMLSSETSSIVNNANKHLHIITSRGKGLLGSNGSMTKSLGFAYSYVGNAVKRKYLERTVERVIFSNNGDLPYDTQTDILPSRIVSLDENNLLPALRASGAIPFMMEGIQNISQGPEGTYWDGGLTDYHIAFPYVLDGIVLHSHFLPYVLQGWFDKKLPRNRRATAEQMSKVLLITPSEEYVKSLPRKQISDMKDFKYFGLDQEARIQYWTEISLRSGELGDEFKSIIEAGRLQEVIQPYTP